MKLHIRIGIAGRLYGAAGTIIVVAAVALGMGERVLERVRIGGREYKGIQLKRDLHDDVAALVSDLHLLGARLGENMADVALKQTDGAAEMIKRIDGAFAAIAASRTRKTGGSVSCASCHDQAVEDAVYSPLAASHDEWRTVAAAVTDLTRRLSNGDGPGGLTVGFRGVLRQLESLAARVGEELDTLASASTAQVEVIESDARSTRLAFLGGALVFVLLLAAGAVALSVFTVRPMAQAGAAAKEIAAEIVAAARQQSASTNETSSAISQTTTTVEEIRQTSDMATEKARFVVEMASRAQSASSQSAQAISQALAAMHGIREEVEGIARTILELSERAIQISEIVQTVNAVAEQSNLLAVNASIEAAKAGEHGKGFSVVASEVKALASQSKQATQQIRSILSDVQKSSNTAVMVTENGVKRVDEGARLIETLASSVEQLVRTIEESADSAHQISAAANQQLSGVTQITEAMHNIEKAARENALGAQQLEHIARRVNQASCDIDLLVGRRSIA